VSSECKSLSTYCLKFLWVDRPTIHQVLGHSWFKGYNENDIQQHRSSNKWLGGCFPAWRLCTSNNWQLSGHVGAVLLLSYSLEHPINWSCSLYTQDNILIYIYLLPILTKYINSSIYKPTMYRVNTSCYFSSSTVRLVYRKRINRKRIILREI